jgi:hypothetical protein
MIAKAQQLTDGKLPRGLFFAQQNLPNHNDFQFPIRKNGLSCGNLLTERINTENYVERAIRLWAGDWHPPPGGPKARCRSAV